MTAGMMIRWLSMSPSVEAMAGRLRAYVEHETPTGATDALNSFADRLISRYGELGGSARRVPTPTGDHVVADFPGRDRRAGQ